MTGFVSAGTFSSIPDSGVSRWTFDNADTSGSTATDVWGGNNATIDGATTGTTGASQTYDTGEAYSFDGNNDRCDVSDDASFSGLPELSFAFWARFNNTSSREKFVAKGVDVGSQRNYEWDITKDSNETVWFSVADGSGYSEVQPSDTLSTNTWYHIVGVYSDTDDYIELYLDGTRIGRIDGVVTMQDDSGPLVFGAENDGGGGGDWLNGDLDDPRLYSKPLSSTEVSNLYSTGHI